VKKYIEQNDNKNRMFQEIYILNKSSVNMHATTFQTIMKYKTREG
jgi:hypothetical protein